MDRARRSVTGRTPPERSGTVSAADRGFLYGDGVFETLRAYSRVPFRLRAHWDRLSASGAFLGIPLPDVDPASEVERALKACGLDDAGVRITLTRGPLPEGPRPTPTGGAPTLLFQARPLRPGLEELARTGVAARRAPWPLRARGVPLHGHKTLNYLASVVALGAVGPGEEAVLLNTEGHLAEGATSNLFWVRRGVLYTPSPEAGCLPGLARALVLEEARRLGLEVEEGLHPFRALAGAEEAFLTNSLVEVLPLVALDGEPLGGGRPGPVTWRLQHAYRGCVQADAGR